MSFEDIRITGRGSPVRNEDPFRFSDPAVGPVDSTGTRSLRREEGVS